MMQPLDAQTMLTNGQLAPLSSRPSPRQHASQRSYLTGAPASYSPLHGPDTGLTLLTTRCGFNTPNLLQRYGPTLLVEVGFDATFRDATMGQRPDLPLEQWMALVDTGASESCIDSSLAESVKSTNC